MAFQALEADYVSNLLWFEEKFEGLVHDAQKVVMSVAVESHQTYSGR